MCVPKKGRDGDGGAPIRPAANSDGRFEAPLLPCISFNSWGSLLRMLWFLVVQKWREAQKPTGHS